MLLNSYLGGRKGTRAEMWPKCWRWWPQMVTVILEHETLLQKWKPDWNSYIKLGLATISENFKISSGPPERAKIKGAGVGRSTGHWRHPWTGFLVFCWLAGRSLQGPQSSGPQFPNLSKGGLDLSICQTHRAIRGADPSGIKWSP